MTTDENNLTGSEDNTSSHFGAEPNTIGELLKQKREEKNLGLKVISQQTKIHISLLENIETNQLDKLPSKTYVRGFIRSTAKILGIDQDEACNLLDKTYQDYENKTHGKKPAAEAQYVQQQSQNLTSSADSSPASFKNISIALGAGAVIVTAALILLNVDKLGSKKEPTKTVAPQETSLSNAEIPEQGKIAVQPAQTSEETPATEVIAEKVETPTPVVVAEEKKPTPEVKVEAKPEVKAETQPVFKEVNLSQMDSTEPQFVEDAMDKETYDNLLPGKFRVDPLPGVQTVFLNAAHGDSWVTYKVDDREIKKFTLRQGRTLFMRGKLIRLFVGNPDSLRVFHNNKPVKVIVTSRSGVRSIVLPAERRGEFMSPLFVFAEDGSVVTSDEYQKIIKQ